MDLSIIVPSIRIDKQRILYESIQKNCTKYTWELILVGPEFDNLLSADNVVFVRNFSCPSVGYNVGASICRGHYVTWSADDGIHENNGFDKALDILEAGYSNDDVVVAKYKEGDDIVHNDDYYRLNRAYPYSPFNNDGWWIFNLAFMHTSYYKKLGGCDSQFQTSAVTLADLAARAQRNNSKVTMLNESTVKFGLMPLDTGDHGPVFRAQFQEDMPNYEKLYNHESVKDRIFINYNNWMFADRIWSKRW